MPSFRFYFFKDERCSACHCVGSANNHDAESPFDTGYQFTRSERFLQKSCLARPVSAPDCLSSISSPRTYAIRTCAAFIRLIDIRHLGLANISIPGAQDIDHRYPQGLRITFRKTPGFRLRSAVENSRGPRLSSESVADKIPVRVIAQKSGRNLELGLG
jgi:hypothetical protein